MNLIASLLLNGGVVLVVSKVLPGVRVKSYGAAVGVAAVYALLSYMLKWLLVVLTLPAIVLTLGLFLIVLNAFLLWLTDKILDSFEIKGKLNLLLATVAITFGQLLVDRILS